MRTFFLLLSVAVVGYFFQYASQTNTALLPFATALAVATATLVAGFLSRHDTILDRARSRADLVTLLSAEMHNFTRHHATNLRRLSSVFEKTKRKNELIEMIERFSFSGRPGASEGELFKVTSVEQLSHLPRFLSRDFMRVHILARNLEEDFRRSLARFNDEHEAFERFQENVTEELYKLGLRLERATVQGELLLDRLEEYEHRSRVRTLVARLARRLTQRPGLRTFIDRPMQPDDTRAYEELQRWREIVRKRNSVTEAQIMFASAAFPDKINKIHPPNTKGLFNDVFKIDAGDSFFAMRWRKNEELFRYDYRVMKDIFVTDLYEKHGADSLICEDDVIAAVQKSDVGTSDVFRKAAQVTWPGPGLYGFGSNGGSPFVVSAWLDGRTGKDVTLLDYRALGKTVAALHGMRFNKAFPSLRKEGLGPNAYFSGVAREISDRNASSGQIVEKKQLGRWIDKRLSEITENLQQEAMFTICHNDLHPYNFFMADGEVTLIDWDNMVIAHPYLDFVKTKYWSSISDDYFSTSIVAFKEFCAGYAINKSVDAIAAESFHKIVGSNPIFKLHEMLWLFRIWTFETGRENSGIQRRGPFPPASYYEPLIWRLVS